MRGRHVWSISHLLLMAGAGIFVSHRGRADGPPPPPPPPAAPVMTAPGAGGDVVNKDGSALGTGRMPTILVHAGRDSLRIEANVELGGLGGSGVIHGPMSALRYALASGDTLELDGHTPAGVYNLADGAQVRLGSPAGYPRYYSYSPKMHPMLVFSIASRRRIGVLVASEETRAFTEQSDAELAELFRSTAQYRSWKVHDEAPLAFAVPLDWYRRAWIELPDSLRDYRVLFFGYGESGDVPGLEPIPRYGAVRFSLTPHPARPAVALPGSERLDLVGEVRLVVNGPTRVRVQKAR